MTIICISFDSKAICSSLAYICEVVFKFVCNVFFICDCFVIFQAVLVFLCDCLTTFHI